MAYTHSKYEVEMVPVVPSGAAVSDTLDGVNLSATGMAARWAPGMVPHIIRGAAVIPYVTTAHDAAVHVAFEGDISTIGTPTRLFKIVVPTAGAIHKAVYYRPTYVIEVKPGSVVDCRVTAAATAGIRGKVVLYVEPRWEEPGNVTSMLSTT